MMYQSLHNLMASVLFPLLPEAPTSNWLVFLAEIATSPISLIGFHSQICILDCLFPAPVQFQFCPWIHDKEFDPPPSTSHRQHQQRFVPLAGHGCVVSRPPLLALPPTLGSSSARATQAPGVA